MRQTGEGTVMGKPPKRQNEKPNQIARKRHKRVNVKKHD